MFVKGKCLYTERVKKFVTVLIQTVNYYLLPTNTWLDVAARVRKRSWVNTLLDIWTGPQELRHGFFNLLWERAFVTKKKTFM